jgi:hypothetical protein
VHLVGFHYKNQNGSSRNWSKGVEWIQKDQHKVRCSALVNRIRNVRSHVLTVVLTKTQVFTDMMLCHVVHRC